MTTKSVGENDNGNLPSLSLQSIVENLEKRYHNDEIYTSNGLVLLAVNPNRLIPHWYSEEMKEKFRGGKIKERGEIPHPYQVAGLSYSRMKRRTQSIVISGESGSGKTETAKYIIDFLTARGEEEFDVKGERRGEEGEETGLTSRILCANVLLESFGNAATVRNKNSSRFGKLNKLFFDGEGNVRGCELITYLLESGRICSQSTGETSFHIFYEIFYGGREGERSDETAGKRRLLSKFEKASDFMFLSPSRQKEILHACIEGDALMEGCSHRSQAQEVAEKVNQILKQSLRVAPEEETREEEHQEGEGREKEKRGEREEREERELYLHNYRRLLKAMERLEFSKEKIDEIHHICVGILYLGEILMSMQVRVSYEAANGANSSGETVSDANEGEHFFEVFFDDEEAVSTACLLLGLEETALLEFLTKKKNKFVGDVKNNLMQVRTTALLFASSLYERFFDDLVTSLAACLQCESSREQAKLCEQSHDIINIVDIYGFENLTSNTLQQLFINFANERLHHFFMETAYYCELETYQKEGIHQKIFGDSNMGEGDDTEQGEREREKLLRTIAGKQQSIFAILDDFSRLLYTSSQANVRNIEKQFIQSLVNFAANTTAGKGGANSANTPRNSSTRLSGNKGRNANFRKSSFSLSHFCGDVEYELASNSDEGETTANFFWLEKNNWRRDTVMETLLRNSSNNIVRRLSQETGHQTAKFVSVSSQFVRRLEILLETLKNSDVHFIKCLLANDRQTSSLFVRERCEQQLKNSSIPQLVILMQKGYPSRIPVEKIDALLGANIRETARQFSLSLPSPRDVCNFLMVLSNVQSSQWTLGVSMLFLRAGWENLMQDWETRASELFASDRVRSAVHQIKMTRRRRVFQTVIATVRLLALMRNAQRRRLVNNSFVRTVFTLVAVNKFKKKSEQAKLTQTVPVSNSVAVSERANARKNATNANDIEEFDASSAESPHRRLFWKKGDGLVLSGDGVKFSPANYQKGDGVKYLWRIPVSSHQNIKHLFGAFLSNNSFATLALPQSEGDNAMPLPSPVSFYRDCEPYVIKKYEWRDWSCFGDCELKMHQILPMETEETSFVCLGSHEIETANNSPVLQFFLFAVKITSLGPVVFARTSWKYESASITCPPSLSLFRVHNLTGIVVWGENMMQFFTFRVIPREPFSLSANTYIRLQELYRVSLSHDLLLEIAANSRTAVSITSISLEETEDASERGLRLSITDSANRLHSFAVSLQELDSVQDEFLLQLRTKYFESVRKSSPSLPSLQSPLSVSSIPANTSSAPLLALPPPKKFMQVISHQIQ